LAEGELPVKRLLAKNPHGPGKPITSSHSPEQYIKIHRYEKRITMNLDHAANSGSPTSFAVPGMHPELAGSSVSTSRPRMMGPAAGQVQGYARVVKEQPKRPLNSYNIFFQVERKRLIAGSSDVGPYSRGEVYSINLDRSASAGKVKRPHRKMHGMISFTDLAKTIASRWKVLDESQKVFFEERASEEKSKYATELEEWLLLQVPTPQVRIFGRSWSLFEKDSLTICILACFR
jgi:hypothetical protein